MKKELRTALFTAKHAVKLCLLLLLTFNCFSGNAQSVSRTSNVYAGGSPFQDSMWTWNTANYNIIRRIAPTISGFTVTGINGYATDPTTGTHYCILKLSAVSGRVLATINVQTGVCTNVGNLGDNFSSITFDASGQLYGVTGDGATVPETMYTINKTNGSKAVFRTLGNGADGEVIMFNPDDNYFYHWSGNGTVVWERFQTAVDAIQNLVYTGTPGGETFGAYYMGSGQILVSNISSNFRIWNTSTLAIGASVSSNPDDIRGLVKDSYTTTITPSGSTSLCIGGNVTLSVSAGTSGYQWYQNGAAIGGATSSTYMATTSGVYNCIYTDQNGIADSCTSGITVSVTGCAASGLNFDGTNDIVTIPRTTALDIPSNLVTIEYWARPTLVDGFFHWVISKTAPNPTIDYLSGVSTSNKWRFIYKNFSIDISSTTTVVANTWYHIAFTYDGTTGRLYVNGVEEASAAASIGSITNANNILLGARDATSPLQYFQGDVDEVKIWSRALCRGEILNNMTCELSPSQTGLLAYYKFNQGTINANNSGTTSLTDASGNSNTGTLSNFALTGLTSNWNTGNVSSTCSPFVALGVVASSNSPVNQGSPINLNATASGTNYGSATFSWTGPNSFTSTSQSTFITNAQAINAGSYSVTATVLGCSATHSTVVAVNPPATALDFDGVNDQLTAPDNASFDAIETGDIITIESWVYIKGYPSGWFPIVNKYELTGNDGWDFLINNTGYMYFGANSAQSVTQSFSFSLNTWYHVAVSYDRSKNKADFFVNGNLIGSPAFSGDIINTSGEDLFIGRSPSGANEYAQGMFDDVRIWSRALCRGEILNNMNCELGGTQTGLVAYYKLNHGFIGSVNSSFNTATDASTNNNTATLGSFALTGSGSNWVAGNVSGTCSSFTGLSVTASNSSPISVGGNINFTSSASGSNSGSATYAWTGPNSFTSSSQNPTLTGATAAAGGIYTVTATAVGCTATATTQANINATGLHFDGANDVVTVNNTTLGNFGSGSFTVEFMIKKTGGTSGGVIGKRAACAGSDGFWRMNVVGGNSLSWELNQAAVPYSTATANVGLNDGNWHHVAWVKNGTNVTVFYDGALVPGLSGTFTGTLPTTGSLQFGGTSSCGQYTDCSMDEVRIWNRALQECEIVNNRNCQLNPAGQTGLLAYYNFNAGYLNVNNAGVTTLVDQTGSGTNNATLNNFALTGTTSNWVPGNTTTACATFVPLSLSVGSNSPVNIGSNVNLTSTLTGTGAGIATYAWTGPNGFTSTSANPTITAATAAATGTYTLTVTMNGCQVIKTVDVVVTLPAVINTHPANLHACTGSTAVFSVGTTYATIFQWQESQNSGVSWANLVNNATYGGVNTSSLNIFNTTLAMSGYQYRCIVASAIPPSLTTNAATLTVNTAPAITTQPGNAVECEGTGTAFTVVATGTNVVYQWQVNQGGGFANLANGGVYSGVNNGTLVLSSTTLAMNGYLYRCNLSNCTNINSNQVSLTVRQVPAVTAHPVNITRCSGTAASFSITGVATGVTYQWQENNGGGFVNLLNAGIYTGVLTNTLNISAVALTMNGYTYRCVVSGICPPAANSNAATLTVGDNPVINTQPVNATTCAGSNSSFSITTTGSGFSYQWQVNQGSGFSNVTNGGVYSGATSATLNITGATAAMNNYIYRCVVTSICNTGGVNSTYAVLTVNTLPAVTAQPVSIAVCVGSNATFSTNATGTGISYQWQENNGGGFVNIVNAGIYSGATSTSLLMTGVTLAMNGYTYRCMVNGACLPAATSNTATLTINTPPAITTNPPNRVICNGSSTTFTVAATGTALTYQWQVNNGTGYTNIANGGVYSGATTTTLSVTGATLAMNGSEYRCMVSGTCPPPAYTAFGLLTVQGPPTITTQPPTAITLCQNSSTSFSVIATGAGLTYQWQQSTNGGATWANLSNGGVYNGVLTSTLFLTNVPTTMNTYRFRCIVSGICTPSPVTSGQMVLTVNALPVINSQSSMFVTQCAGTSTVMSVSAGGTSITYQWQESTDGGTTWNNLVNGAPYANVTTASMTLTGTPVTLNGYKYRCVVTGICAPPAISQPVSLTVNTVPAITVQPVSVTLCEGGNTNFNITATGTGISYQWQLSTNGGGTWSNMTNNFTYSGVTTTSLNLTAVTGSMNTYRYRCIVTGVCAPAAISSQAILTVNVPPTLTSQPVDRNICQGTNTTFATSATGTAVTYQWQVDNGGGFVNLVNGAPYSNVTTATMTISAATLAMDGFKYRCVVSGTCTPPSTTVAAKLTVWATTAIAVQSISIQSCPGDTTSFGLTAIGAGLIYNWQMNAGSGWVALPSGSAFGGLNTPVITIYGVQPYMNGYQYRCIVTGNCGGAVTSAIIPMTVLKPVTMQIHTISATVCEGGKVKLGVKALGVNLIYRWQVKRLGGYYEDLINGAPYSGVSTDSLEIMGIDTLHGKLYRCFVSDPTMCAIYKDSTSDIILKVEQAPITTPPALTVKVYQAALFNVQMGGVYYQWQVDNGTGFIDLTNTPPYVGVNGSTLRIYPLNMTLNGNRYRCVVDGICATTTISDPATLTIDPAVSVGQVPTKGMNYMTVYPNPVSEGSLNIRFDEQVKGATELRVMDKLGRVVLVKAVEFDVNRTALLEVNQLAAGTYTLHVVNESEGINSTIRFTKQ